MSDTLTELITRAADQLRQLDHDLIAAAGHKIQATAIHNRIQYVRRPLEHARRILAVLEDRSQP